MTSQTQQPGIAEQIHEHFLHHVLPWLRVSVMLSRHAADQSLATRRNPLTRFAGRVYSQNDEDGITFEILRRLGVNRGVFAEFGVGDGTQNNTLALVAARWPGFWVGGEELKFNPNPDNVPMPNFDFQKAWIKTSNLLQLYETGLARIRQTHCDLISMDLDGNDYYFVDALLSAGASPKVFIVEYNSKFVPPIRFKIAYDDAHEWAADDYFGASLCSFVDLFERHGYFLACCNLAGINAFFVHNKYRKKFADVPREIEQLFMSPRFFFHGPDLPNRSSLRTIEALFRALNSPTGD
jgi:hypothetical protein